MQYVHGSTLCQQSMTGSWIVCIAQSHVPVTSQYTAIRVVSCTR